MYIWALSCIVRSVYVLMQVEVSSNGRWRQAKSQGFFRGKKQNEKSFRYEFYSMGSL